MTRIARLLTVLLVTGLFACDGTELTDASRSTPAATPSHAAGGPAAGAEEENELAQADVSRIARITDASGLNGVQRAFAMIGAEGGSVQLGDFEIVVPAGAVDGPTRFEIRLPPVKSNQRYAAASFSPHNQPFNVPVIIRLPHANTDAAGEAADVLWWNQGQWIAYPTTQTPDGRIETSTDHFSLYATSRFRGITMVGG